MRLKDGLVLREVAGQYVIVPTGKRVLEIPKIHYMTKDAAMLWDFFYGHDFTEQDLVDKLKSYFPKSPEQEVLRQIRTFIESLRVNGLIENNTGGTEMIILHKYKSSEMR